jgi:hypothetical protein
LVLDPASQPQLHLSWRPPEPRATRLAIDELAALRTEVWFGGAESAAGEPVRTEHVRGAWLVDLAGDLPASLRESAAASFSRVFTDVEAVPSSFDRILGLARAIGLSLAGEAPPLGKYSEVPPEPPGRLYVLCSQGLNRSALFAGLVLREAGADPRSVLAAIRRSRAGALTNETFLRLLLG